MVVTVQAALLAEKAIPRLAFQAENLPRFLNGPPAERDELLKHYGIRS